MTPAIRSVGQLNADPSPAMTFQEQNRTQGVGVTKDEIEIIKSNLATVFSNGKNIFYEKGIINIPQMNVSSIYCFYQMTDVQSLSKMPQQNFLMSLLALGLIF